MSKKSNGSGLGRRLQWGSIITSAAHGLDLHAIAERYKAFETIHTTYAAVQVEVDGLDREIEELDERVGELDAVQEELLGILSGYLIADRQPAKRPFSRFTEFSLAELLALSPLEQAKEIRRLAAAVQRDTALSKATVQAAEAVDKAARDVEQAAASMPELQAKAREARQRRESLAPRWEKARAGLAIAARSADHDGGTQYYKTLFGGVNLARRKRPKAATPAAADGATV